MATSLMTDAALNTVVYPLGEDPGLAEKLPESERADAIRACPAQVMQLSPGPWGSSGAESLLDGIGMLVLDGLLIRRVGIDGRFGAELLGEGDLLRPWQGEDDSPTLPLSTGWHILRPTRLAILDERFARSLAPFPQVTARIVARAVQRSRNLAVNMAIVHQARVDVRLHMLFWHLAERWGRVRSDSVVLPFRLTHSVLADLVAAGRPTVSSALSNLTRQGVLDADGDTWRLKGEPPGELLEIEQVNIRSG